MSLAGIAIAIGDVADMGIIMTENIYRRVAAEPDRPHGDSGLRGATEVGGAILTAVSNTIISFIPVFALTDQEGKLFKPLAYTKTFAIAASVILALTLVPVLCYYLLKPARWSRAAVAAAGACGSASPPSSPRTAAWRGAGVVQQSLDRLADGRRRRRHGRRRPSIAWAASSSCRWRKTSSRAASIAVYRPTLALGPGPQGDVPGDSQWRSRSWACSIWLGFAPAGLPGRSGGCKRSGLDPTQTRRLGRLDAGLSRHRPRVHAAARRRLAPLHAVAVAVGVADPGRRKSSPGRTRPSAKCPEVESVVGKVGRAESALDPAPIGMIETIILLKPESKWRQVHQHRWHSDVGWLGMGPTPLLLCSGRKSAASPRQRSSRSCRRRPPSPACCRPGCSRSRPGSSCCRPASAP